MTTLEDAKVALVGHEWMGEQNTPRSPTGPTMLEDRLAAALRTLIAEHEALSAEIERLRAPWTDEQVKAAAHTFAEAVGWHWDSLEPLWQEQFWVGARAALDAARQTGGGQRSVMLRHPDGTPKTNDEIRAEAAAIRGEG